MDMSKAFDTISRNTLMDDIRRIVEPDDLHLIKILVEQVELSVKCGQTTGTPFTTDTGVPQGDCLSPLFFILYLAKAMNHEPHLQEHSYCMPKELGIPEPTEIQDQSYSLTTEKIHQISKETLTL